MTGNHRPRCSIAFEREPGRLPLRNCLASLRLFVDRSDTWMLPAPGAAQPGTRARAAELLEHHRARLTTVADLVAACHLTAYVVAAQFAHASANSLPSPRPAPVMIGTLPLSAWLIGLLPIVAHNVQRGLS
ncbi:hypothetical protein AB0D13_40210 [Streptomyces sp. NPDC048430]|uniref:hypothetical protein n=1 Tax=Streptomyces sp. NPDC048430 TaxID=3155388 RepID=UPI003432DF9A